MNNCCHSSIQEAWGPQEVAAFLKIGERTLDQLRQDDNFPKPRTIGRLPRWSPQVLNVWLANGHSMSACATGAAETGDAESGETESFNGKRPVRRAAGKVGPGANRSEARRV